MKVRELVRVRAVKAKRAAQRFRFLRPRRRSTMDPTNLRGAKGALRRSAEEREEDVPTGALADEWLLGGGPAYGPRGGRVSPR